MDELARRRIALNNARFREANERIGETAAEYEMNEQLLPFLCECADLDCTQIVHMTLHEYEELRSDPQRFANAPGHEDEGEARGEVLERTDRFVFIRKMGAAGEVVRKLDTRADKNRQSASG